MTIQMERIPKSCPICGIEWHIKEEESAELERENGPRVIHCPNCSFKLELPYTNVEDDAELLQREDERESAEFLVATQEPVPREDAMRAYTGTAAD